MRWDRRCVGLALLCLGLAGCGGGGEGRSTARLTSTSGPMLEAEDRLVVLRWDFDQDSHADLLTLDVTEKDLRVVEALQGLPGGTFVDASERWRGRRLDGDVETALWAYLGRSVEVATETELELVVRGQPVLVSVIE